MSNKCGDESDTYGIISSVYYVIFGLLGLATNSSYLNDVHSYLVMTGVGGIMEFSGFIDDFMQIPLVICSGLTVYKFLSEFIKRWSGEVFDESEKVMGLRGEKFYRLPTAFLALVTSCYVCISIIYYNVYLTVSLLVITQMTALAVTRKFYPKGTEHYTITRRIFIRLLTAVVLGCVGLGTSNICPSKNWLWIRLFIGYPIANVCLPYSLFTSAQLALMLRGTNLSRRTAFYGNNFIYITYYVARFSREKQV